MSKPLSREELQSTLQDIYTEEMRLYSAEIINKVPAEEERIFYSERLELGRKRGELGTALLSLSAKDLSAILPSLQNGVKELQQALNKLDKFIKVMDTLGRLIGVMTRVLTVAAVPEVPLVRSAVASPFAAMEETLSFRSAHKVHRLDSAVVERLVDALPPEREVPDSPPEDVPVEQVPVEEVLHGIELTDQKLIITVATGGCTKKDDFHVEVNKGFTRLPPYLVTVYRIKSDDCRGNFEPIRISFSLKELGLEGNVDFRVLNRIGNTSDHRLKQ